MGRPDVARPPAVGSIAVIGAGAFGTALANAAAETGRAVRLWGRDAAAMDRLQASRANPRLPGVPLAPGVTATGDLGDLIDAGLVLLVVPAQAQRPVAALLQGVVHAGVPVVTCAKGIEMKTGAFMTEVIAETLPDMPAAILSGPSFAADLARGLPTAMTLAAQDERMAARLAEELSTGSLRLYHSGDPRGVEIGGAGKNVLAIGAGILEGAGLGESAKAALVARGFAELGRFARACGGRPETLMGLSGLGDLVLTASSPKSRNHAFGVALGQGVSVEEAAGGRLAEGAFTAAVLVAKAKAAGVEMPISEAVDAVIAGRLTVKDAAARLMRRPVKGEG